LSLYSLPILQKKPNLMEKKMSFLNILKVRSFSKQWRHATMLPILKESLSVIH